MDKNMDKNMDAFFLILNNIVYLYDLKVGLKY